MGENGRGKKESGKERVGKGKGKGMGKGKREIEGGGGGSMQLLQDGTQLEKETIENEPKR